MPPYGLVANDGTISGLSVELWRRVAERLKRPFQLQPFADIKALLESVHSGRIDVAVGAITITPERVKLVEFCYPAHRSGVAIAVARRTGLLLVLKSYLSALEEVAPLLALTFIGLIATGLAMWRIERSCLAGKQESHVSNLRDGLYWAVVTMTTVGYGDKTPKTTPGRLVAMSWMFASLFLISLLSTSIVAKLTAERVATAEDASSMDLRHEILAAASASSGAEYLDMQRLTYAKVKGLDEALEQLKTGHVTAVINSVGALRYAVSRSYDRDIQVAQGLLAPAYMAFALLKGSSLREPIDDALIRITSSSEWMKEEERSLLH